MIREIPTLNVRTIQTTPHSVTNTGTVKPDPREHLTAYKADGKSKKLKKCNSTLTQNNSKVLYSAIKIVYGPSTNRTNLLIPASGSTVIKEKEEIRARKEENINQPLVTYR